MKFAGYLTEATLNRKKIKQILDRDCAQYLKEAKHHYPLLFRGAHKKEGGIIKIKHRKDRVPSDTPQLLHDTLNDIFKDIFGWPVRGGIFTASDMGTARNYGIEFNFFPIGDYKYVYSPKIKDLYTHFEDKDIVVDFDEDDNYVSVDDYEDYMGPIIKRQLIDKKGKGMKWVTKKGQSIINIDRYFEYLRSQKLWITSWPYYMASRWQMDVSEKGGSPGIVNSIYLVDWDKLISYEKYSKTHRRMDNSKNKKKIDKVIMDAVKTYKDTGLYNFAISTASREHEITFWCDYYYLVDTDAFIGDFDGVFGKKVR